MKTAVVLAFLFCIVNSAARAQSCDCDHVIDPPADSLTSVFIDGQNLNVQPGQTVCLKAGFYKQVRFVRFYGLPGNPITVRNCGGLVQLGDSTHYGRWYAADVVSSSYFRITGSGDPSLKYGIVLGRSGDSGLKIGASTDIEIDHLEIGSTGFAGILAKSDYGGNPPANAPEMNNVNIHDNYIHDTRGEGMYIGETKTPGQHFRHLEVWNNVVARTGLDLFQVANVVEDVQVHHNVFYQAGTRNVLYQNKGLQIGDNSVGRYYNNFVIGSPSNSMIIMGSGDIEVFNNYFQGAVDPGFFIDNRSVSLPDEPINIYDNYMMDVRETVPFFNIYNEVNPVNITGNKVEGNNVLIGYGSGAGPMVSESGNTRAVIPRVQFVDAENNNFHLVTGSPYSGLGLQDDVSGRNARPYIALIDDQTLGAGTESKLGVFAKDDDRDDLILEAFNLPAFVSFSDKGKGRGLFTMRPVLADTGVYYKVRVRVTDSRGSMNTQYFAITVAAPDTTLSATRLPNPPKQSRTLAQSSEEVSADAVQAVRVYPNPVADEVTVDLGMAESQLVTVEISDLAGHSFFYDSWKNTSQFIDLDLNTSDMEPGLYLLKVKQDDLPVKVVRLVKQ